MLVYRICKEAYANDLSGQGSKLYGGRWNSKGTSVIYTASSISLAMLEILVHLPQHLFPKDMVLVTIELPKTYPKTEILVKDCPKFWDELPPHKNTQKIGDAWTTKNDELVLLVPSTIVAQETNYILNPSYSKFSGVKVKKIESISFDKRLGD